MNGYNDKSTKFYSEVVLTTIVSLVSTAFWVEFFRSILTRYFKNSEYAFFITAVISTIIAVLMLYFFFGTKKNEEKEKFIKHT